MQSVKSRKWSALFSGPSSPFSSPSLILYFKLTEIHTSTRDHLNSARTRSILRQLEMIDLCWRWRFNDLDTFSVKIMAQHLNPIAAYGSIFKRIYYRAVVGQVCAAKLAPQWNAAIWSIGHRRFTWRRRQTIKRRLTSNYVIRSKLAQLFRQSYRRSRYNL